MFLDNKMLFFFDTEFTGLQQDTDLISIGIISETGRRFYAEFTDYRKEKVDEWIRLHVIDNLMMGKNHSNEVELYRSNSADLDRRIRGTTEEIREDLDGWLQTALMTGKKGMAVMVSDCLAYDWVLFNRLMSKTGNANGIPDYIYYIPMDISTMLFTSGNDPDVSREKFAIANPDAARKHNAMWDAEVIKKCYDRMVATSYENLKRSE